MKSSLKTPHLSGAIRAGWPILLGVFLGSSVALATDWQGSTGAFNNGANWVGGAVPNAAAATANVSNGGTVSITTGDSFTENLLTLGTGSSSRGFVTQTDGVLSAYHVILGGTDSGSNTGQGTYTMSGGELDVGDGEIYIGSRSTSTGTLNVNGSALITSTNGFYLGRDGSTGNVNLAGNGIITMTATGGDPYFAIGLNSKGYTSTVTAGGVSSVNSSNELYVGWFGDNTVKGVFTVQDSATLTVKNGLVVGRNGGQGTMNISNNAIVSIGGGLMAGADPNGNGTIIINDGVIVTAAWLAAPLNNSSQGTIIINGGTVTTTANSGSLQGINFDATSPGVKGLTLNGGTLVVNGFNKSGGTNAVSVNLNGGMIRASGDNPNFFGGTTGFTNSDVSFQGGGLTFDTNGHAVMITQTLAGAGALTKIGAGTLTLTGANTLSGATTVGSGTLSLGATGALGGSGDVRITSGATLNFSTLGAAGFTLANGRKLSVDGSTIGTLNVSGTLTGSGVISGTLKVNADGLVSGTSGTLSLMGMVVNSGTMRFTGGATLDARNVTSFINYGVIDLLTGGGLLPANFVNGAGGVVLTSDLVRIKQFSRTGAAVNLTIDSFTGHSYQLQRSPSLVNSSYLNVGSPQNGSTGTTLNFSDPSPNSTQGFYRVQLVP